MPLPELLRKIIKEYRDTDEVLKNAEGTAALPAYDAHARAEGRLANICHMLSDTVDGKALYDQARKVLPPEQLHEATTALIDIRRAFISERLGQNDPDRNAMMQLPRTAKPDVQQKSLDELDKYAKKYLSPDELETYRHLNFLKAMPRAYFAKGGEAYVTLLSDETVLSSEKADALAQQADAFVPVPDQADEVRTQPVAALPDDTAGLSPDEIAALDYVKANVRLADREYSSYLDGRNVLMMGLVKKENRELIRQYYEEHPENKELFGFTENGLCVQNDKQAQFQALVDQEFEFTDDARGAMREIMHILDDFGTLTNDNVCMGEEGAKIYSCAAIFEATTAIEKAIKEGRYADLPRLTAQHARVKAQTDRMLELAQTYFTSGELNYVDNLDVARNGYMPPEYRMRNRDVTCLSTLYCSLKICKILGVSIDDFVKAPNRYLNQARYGMINRYNLEFATRGRAPGDKLFLLSNPTVGIATRPDLEVAALCMRAGEGFRSMDNDPTHTMHNVGTRLAGSDYFFDIMNTMAVQKPLNANIDETVQNMLLFDDGHKSIYELSANLIFKYDPTAGKIAPMIDTETAISETVFNYDELTKKTRDLYNGYMKNCLRAGLPADTNVIGAIKSLSEEIAKKRPEAANDPEFKAYRKFAKSLTATPTVKTILEIDGKDELTEQIKGASLLSLYRQQKRYARISRGVRFASYLPFVNNSATRLRNEIKENKALLQGRGVAKAEIDRALGGEEPAVTAGQPEITLEGIDYRKIDVRSEHERDMAEHFNDYLGKDLEPKTERAKEAPDETKEPVPEAEKDAQPEPQRGKNG